MNKIITAIAYVGVTCCLCACSTKTEEQGLKISLDISQAKEIRLDTTSTSMPLSHAPVIASIKDIFVIDTCIYIYHGQAISTFNKDGVFAGNITHQGRAGNEYISLWYAFVDKGNIVIYDMNGRKMLKYFPGTNKIEETPLPEKMTKFFQALYPYEGGFVAKLGFNGSEEMPPELGYFDDNYQFQETIGDLVLNSGLWLGRPFSGYKKDVLYWRQLDNFIYAIDKNKKLHTKYYVDFLKHNIPAHKEFIDDYEKIEFINKSPDSYATYLSYVLETNDKVYFTFIFSAKKYLAVYDKADKSASVFSFAFDKDEALNNIIPLEGGIYVVSDKTDGTSRLYILQL